MCIRAPIVVGCSAGGVAALITLVSALPKDFGAPLCIALHTSRIGSSRLPAILTRLGTLPVSHALPGTRLVPGQIFLAPPNHHLLIEGERLAVVQSPPERPRPSIDLLFESAARSYGERAVGVILTGALTDGTAGLQVIKNSGGTTIIQDPEEAAYPSMPRSAQQHCAIDYCLPLARIAPLLQELTAR